MAFLKAYIHGIEKVVGKKSFIILKKEVTVHRFHVQGLYVQGSGFSENFYPLLSKMAGFVPRLIEKTTTKVR